MSVEVVSPNGVRIVYNNGNHIEWLDDGCKIYNADPNKNGNFIARVSKEWAISFHNACIIQHKGKIPEMTVSNAIDIVRHSCNTSINSYTDTCKLAEIKSALKDLDGRSKSWIVKKRKKKRT